jgi:hypothetical protein
MDSTARSYSLNQHLNNRAAKCGHRHETMRRRNRDACIENLPRRQPVRHACIRCRSRGVWRNNAKSTPLPADPGPACSSLSGATISAKQIGLPTSGASVVSATLRPASGSGGHAGGWVWRKICRPAATRDTVPSVPGVFGRVKSDGKYDPETTSTTCGRWEASSSAISTTTLP